MKSKYQSKIGSPQSRKTRLKPHHNSQKTDQESPDAKLEFLTRVSHEFRTPLTSIVGFSDLLDETHLSEKQRAYLQAITVSAKSLRNLINDLLDFSKIQSGQLQIDQSEFNLEKIFHDVIQISRFHGIAKSLKFIYYIDERIHFQLLGDPHRLQQILVNLVGNAVKFTKSGKIYVSAFLDSETDEGFRIYFSVRDTGIGITKEAQQTIFESFVQADTSTTRVYGGTGIGLPISNRLVELMGGEKISVESEVGLGSTFSFILPFKKGLAINSVDDLEELEFDSPQIKLKSADKSKEGAFKILIAEDIPLIVELLTEILSQEGYKVFAASDGAQAIEILKNEDCHLVLMDLYMPVMNGFEATKQIRALGIDIPIYALTASTGAELRKGCLAVGMDGILTKPIDVAQVKQILQEALQKPPAKKMNSQPSPRQMAPVDMNDMMQRFPNKEIFFRGLLRKFVDESPGRLKKLVQAVDHKDLEDIWSQAHSLKGVAASLNATHLQKLARDLEMMGKSKDLSTVFHIIDEIQEEFLRIDDYLLKFDVTK